MGRRRLLREEYRSLGLLLTIVAALAAGVIASCGGGGGSSNGELCQQCGLSPDGPCQSSFTVVPGSDQPPPCDAVDAPNPCPLTLICRRKVDSAQQRCYPADPANPQQVNFSWRCDGSRPGGTARPEPTLTPTATTGATATAVSPGATCGNGSVESGEECDGSNLNGQDCLTAGCDSSAGALSCDASCMFNFTSCLGGNCP